MGYRCSMSRCTVKSQFSPLMRKDRIGLSQEGEEAKVDFQKTPSFHFCKVQVSSLWPQDGSTHLWQYPRTLGVTQAWNKDLYSALGKTGAYRLLWLLLLSGFLLCNGRFLARKVRGIVLVFLIKLIWMFNCGRLSPFKFFWHSCRHYYIFAKFMLPSQSTNMAWRIRHPLNFFFFYHRTQQISVEVFQSVN